MEKLSGSLQFVCTEKNQHKLDKIENVLAETALPMAFGWQGHLLLAHKPANAGTADTRD